ncbi:MAG: penicillin-binding transpeptidase domain-containing protein [Myxococcota bacterium]|nr:penicillin-binding transpeptidase domain-containing protein [Myxococcota bacterium]
MRSQALRSAAIRIGVLRLVMLVGVLALAGRAGQLAIMNPEAAAHGERQLHTRITLPASRGLILDRNHKELAISVDAPSVYVVPGLLEDRKQTFRALGEALELEPEAIARRVGQRTGFTFLARWIETDRAQRIEELDLPGVGIEYEPRRTYPAGRMAGTLIGFADIDGQGRRGIEQMMDEWLRGRPQQLAVQRDARGRLLGRIAVDPRKAAGGDVALTLDAGLQAEAEAALAHAVQRTKAKRGLVIVVDPATGDVLTLAEWPGFDPNDFRNTPYSQTRSPAFLDALEPGSTIKAFLVATALEHGAVSQTTRIDTEERWVRLPGKTIRDHHPYGVLDPRLVLQYSSNVGAVWIGQQLGSETYHSALTAFGLGRRTQSGFPSESAGLLRDWRKWQPIDQATASFGQGMNVTPIQLAMAIAALANGGTLMQPRLIQARRTGVGEWQKIPPVVASQVISPDTAKTTLEMLTSVVSAEGTGRLAALAQVPVAGKTGTAQHLDTQTGRYSNRRYTAWFAGVAPADNPKMALVVALDEPQGWAHSGGAVAAPLFATVATSQLARHGIMTEPEPIPAPLLPTWKVIEQERLAQEKARTESAALPKRTAARTPKAVSSPPPANRVRRVQATRPPGPETARQAVMVPNFRGVSVTRAVQIAETETLDLEISGPQHGQVVDQSPAAGTVMIGRLRTVELQVAALREGG